MAEHLTWKRLLSELLLFCTPALLLGLLVGYYSELLLIAALAALWWSFYNQIKLSHWLYKNRAMTPPTSRGSWGSLFNGLYYLQQRNRQRRWELVTLIRRFRTGAESLPDGVVVCTEKGRIFWCNKLAQHLLGLRWPEDSGQYLLNLVRNPEFSAYLQANDFSRYLVIPSPINHERYVEFRIMDYGDGQMLIAIRDISKIRQLEGMRRNFFANASHELRTPLTVLQGYLEMVDEDINPMQWPKIRNTMLEQTQRMVLLVEQILTLSHLESSSATIQAEQIDMPAILQQLQNEMMVVASRHILQFEVDNTLKVYGHYEQLRSAVSNLIYNAIYHTPDGSVIKVYWRATPEGAYFEVWDNGPGILSHHLDRLTERFYRVESSRSRKSGGSGLGLAIVKIALSHHNSRLNIQSTFGKGSQFSFLLPHPYPNAKQLRD